MREDSALAGASAVRSSSFQIESLEKRVLLSTSLKTAEWMAQNWAPTTHDISDVKNGPMARAGGALIDLYRDFRRFRNSSDSLDSSGQRVTYQPTSQVLLTQNDHVGVFIRTSGSFDQLVQRLRDIGGELIYRHRPYRAVEAFVPIGSLHDLAAHKQTLQMRGLDRAVVSKQGISPNQADRAHYVDAARDAYNLSGAGVKVGVLSDSFSRYDSGYAGSMNSGDLPPGVQVIQEGPFGSSDEGRAMLELIHDLVPNAQLAFATAFTGLSAFANNIIALQQAGADVIVDDVGYLTDPMFQEGVVGSAISVVRDRGATYLSSAGNSGFGGFEKGITYIPQQDGTWLVDFRAGPSVDTRMRVNVAQGGNFILQWDDAWNGVVGDVNANLDIYVYNAFNGRRVTFSADDNFLTGMPGEIFFLFPGTYDIEIRVDRILDPSDAPTRFKIAGFGEIRPMQHRQGTTLSSGWGHSSSEFAISVGAVPFSQADPFLYDRPIVSESFSSAATQTLTRRGNGTRRPTPLVLEKPDVSGIDGTNTSFFGSFRGDGEPGLRHFYGTSAAAPNVAAVAAMLYEFKPNISPDEVTVALVNSAKTRPLNGAREKQWDPQGGWGLVDSVRALQEIDGSPVARWQRMGDPHPGAIDSATLKFSTPVTGVDLSDFVLTRNSSSTNLLAGADDVTVTSPDGGLTWIVSGLAALTDSNATYTLRLEAQGSGIEDAQGRDLRYGPSLVIGVELQPPVKPLNLVADSVSPTRIDVSWEDRSDDELGFRLQRSTDPTFAFETRTWDLPANTTRFQDEGLHGGVRYYYRVRAFNEIGSSTYTSGPQANVFTRALGDIVVDNNDAVLVGAWDHLTEVPGAFLGDVLTDDNTGKGTKRATFGTNIPVAGNYVVYARWVPGADRATNVPMDVVSGGRTRTVTVNQRDRGANGGWVMLGTYFFDPTATAAVTIRTTGTDGVVVADAVRFQATFPVTQRQIAAAATATPPLSARLFASDSSEEQDVLEV